MYGSEKLNIYVHIYASISVTIKQYYYLFIHITTKLWIKYKNTPSKQLILQTIWVIKFPSEINTDVHNIYYKCVETLADIFSYYQPIEIEKILTGGSSACNC